MNNTAIIVVAAGSSSRFGRMKQLVHYNSKTLLQHVADEAIGSGANSIIVVTGYHADEVAKETHGDNIRVVFNKHWEDGIASSIVTGVETATASGDINKLIIAVCDQPFISSSVFNQLCKIQEESAKTIVASAYAGTVGTPVLFTQKYFNALKALKGDEGAKKIVQSNKDDVATIDFSEGAIDIDTQEDYNELIDRQKHVL